MSLCEALTRSCACAGVVTTTDVDEATQGVEVAVLVGGFPRKAGMERKDVMSKNVSIYKSQASSLEKNAAPGVKVGSCLTPFVQQVRVILFLRDHTG